MPQQLRATRATHAKEMTNFEPRLIGGGSGMFFLLAERSLAGLGTSEETEGALFFLAPPRAPPAILMLAWPGVVLVSWVVEGSAVVVILVSPEPDVVAAELAVVTRPDLK